MNEETYTDREKLEQASRAEKDKKLLRLASKGLTLGRILAKARTPNCEGWNPLENDADALELAVRKRLEIRHNTHDLSGGWVQVADPVTGESHTAVVLEENLEERMAATRRAIVEVVAKLYEITEVRGMDFGAALREMRGGRRVARAHWAVRGVGFDGAWIEIQPPELGSVSGLGYLLLCHPDDAIYTPGARVAWVPSQVDILSEDWQIVPE